MRAIATRAMRIVSWLLLAAGAFFLISGARDFLIPIIGQHQISEKWKEALSKPAPEAGVPGNTPETDGTVCRLLIPRLDAHFFVVEGVDKGDLRVGPGHMQGSAMPGQKGNCIIAGHRDTHFRMLKDLHKGDDIVLQTRAGEYHYQVKHLSIVSPRDNEALQPTSTPVLSLITCYPFYYVGPAPKRFVVQAALEVPEKETTASVAPASNPPLKPASTTRAASRKSRRPPRIVKATYHPPHRASATAVKHDNIVKRMMNRIVKRLHPGDGDES